jgi:hypothetical protein
MMDVFKYLKKVNALLEASAVDQAREMGLEYAGYGKWRDPRTGQVTHRSTKSGGQTTLEKLDASEEPKQQPTQQEPQQQTFSQFKQITQQQAQPEPPVGDQMNRVVPGGPSETALASGDKKEVVKQLSRGRGNVMSATRKKQISQQADDMITKDEPQIESEDEAQEPEGLDDLLSDIRGEETPKDESEFIFVNYS